MAAVFLVTLYEYSPLFYIAVVFVCFLVTSGLVLGWFGWDVPVILRNSEETESSAGVSKKQMRQVKNPFGLEILHLTAASVTKGITLKPDCLEDCFLTCYWGCSVQKLYEALQKHIYCFRIKTPQALEDALYNEYLYRQQYFIKKTDKEEKYCQLSEDAQITDFGPVPRSCYPLVALLTLAEEEDREIYDIISMVSIIHVPDESYRLSCRILYQYLLLAQGQFHDLKQLFMSANSSPPTSDPPPGERDADRTLLEKVGLAEDEPEWHEETSKDCVVCQNATVNWVLLPCRHACLCDGCMKYFQQCPMCRQFVQESFPLCSRKEQDEAEPKPVL
ncbi:cell growth regulator with RING finger domain protein 1 isoform X1 [Alligator mississippiensis]|uniref:Cell growth regulator with RING finger domain protein 1 n=1 Tax=Alligator mississippiensis TaxID=8496 RepID=A0A151N3G5_ALLMI|nr:cell growth regulator with RING finger domain protein 1 isoform X1 [Alligator mississippiensis]KYO31308.1 cell growth regulator with RING finger domain protein 1 [Alligator mississippiensis]